MPARARKPTAASQDQNRPQVSAPPSPQSPSPSSTTLTYTLVPVPFPDFEAVDGWIRREAVNHSDVHLKMERVSGEARSDAAKGAGKGRKKDAGGLMCVYFCAHPSGCPAGARVVLDTDAATTSGGGGGGGGSSKTAPPTAALRLYLIGPHSPSCASAQRHQAGPIPADTYRRLMELFDEDWARRPSDVIRILEEEELGWDHTKIRYKWQNAVKARKQKQQRQVGGGGNGTGSGSMARVSKTLSLPPSLSSSEALAALSATATAAAADAAASASAAAADYTDTDAMEDSDLVAEPEMDNLNLLLTASAASSAAETPRSRKRRRREEGPDHAGSEGEVGAPMNGSGLGRAEGRVVSSARGV